MNTPLKTLCALLIASAAAVSPAHAASPAPDQEESEPAELNLYSSRQSDLLKPVLDAFSAQSNIKVNLLNGKIDALIERLAREGKNSPADALVTTDIARLHRAAEKGLLAPLESATVASAVPAHLRDMESGWTALSLRSRVIAYNPERINTDDIRSYLDLADERFRGQVCMRSSNNEYNQSLLAALIHHHGEAAALEWVKGVVANIVRHPQGNDRGQLDLIAAGACDLSVVNTYYMGLWLLNPANLDKEYLPKLLFPEQGEDQPGAHINISGAGIVATSKRKSLAKQFIEFLLSEQGQAIYSHANQEYPIRPDMEASESLRELGWPVRFDAIDVKILGRLNSKAVRTFDEGGWR